MSKIGENSGTRIYRREGSPGSPWQEGNPGSPWQEGSPGSPWQVTLRKEDEQAGAESKSTDVAKVNVFVRRTSSVMLKSHVMLKH